MTDVEVDYVSSGDISADAERPVIGTLVSDVAADGVVSETLALRKELGSGSDVTGSSRWWIRFMGECAIQFQDYSEAWVISMMMVEFQATGPR
ncbi:Piezo-Type Mechanosensitive Ion Channel Component 1 [Manis pentadactyla]|nr:Piezo-Type Mechanosensitive Ion Channel Component 1 [Manis pentadactyla]